jgi:hypothetical protein
MAQHAPTSDPEWDNMIAAVRKLVDSGTKPSVIAYHPLNTVKPTQEKKVYPQR